MRALVWGALASPGLLCRARPCTLPPLLTDGAAPYDASNCSGLPARGTCTVACSRGHEGEPSEFRCPGPARRLQGRPPACVRRGRACDVGARPREAWAGAHVTDDCGGSRAGGRCTAACARGYAGPAESLACLEDDGSECTCFRGRRPQCSPRCVGTSDEPRPSQVFPGLTDSCQGVREEWGQCTERCENETNGTSWNYTCAAAESGPFAQPHCTCFQGPRPTCGAPATCKIPASREAAFDFSSCKTASRKCLVACPSGTYGDPSVFTCPEGSPDAERTWNGTLPTCRRCDATQRPSQGRPDLDDTCESAAKGDVCSASCRPEFGGASGTKQEFTCQRAAPRAGPSAPSCACFTTSDPPLHCQRVCTIRSRPQDLWSLNHVEDDCGQVQVGQSCTARCAEGFRGASQPFQCVDAQNSTCTCFDGKRPDCLPDHAPCKPVPPVPNATAPDVQEVPHLGFAEYRCAEGFTVEGSPDGNRSFRLQCVDGYLAGYELAGCAPAGTPDLWPACPLSEAMQKEGLDASGCRGVREGGSCTVACAAGYYQPGPGRFAEPGEAAPVELPALLVCRGGSFNGSLPLCVQGAEGGMLEFDVYAAVRGNESRGPPSNVNVYDLEGLLAHLYTDLLFFQQVLAQDPNLSRDPSTGAWVGQPPRLPTSRDEVDAVVWYRMKVRNPPDLPTRYTVNLEFGMFADFAWGGAASEGAKQLFQEAGAVVGVSQQLPGLVEVYLPRDGSTWTPAKCSNPRWVGTPDWRSNCRSVEAPRADPRYVPAGRFNSFSLPGACPNLPTDQKTDKGTMNASCTRTSSGQFLSGGLCHGDRPDGTAECTYTLQEIARVSLDDISGVAQEDCGGRGCRDLRDFQLHCGDRRLRNGVRIAGSQERECTEHAVPSEAVNASARACGNATVDAGQTWSCYGPCRDSEASAGALARRCDAGANARRLARLRGLLRAAAAGGAPPSPAVLQDCGERFPQGCRPDALRGLNFCERDGAGLCGACYVPNTTRFDPARVRNMWPCRRDLFSSGGYAALRRPVCPGPGQAGYGTDFACCRYLNDCPREWRALGPWSACGDGRCGEALQTLPMACPLEDELGDCRRDLGDPRGSGFCEAGSGCFAARVCRNAECPWFPYCPAGEARHEGSDFCLPPQWGPLDSACAWGSMHHYVRCSLYYPKDPATREDTSLLCANSSRPQAELAQLVPTQSRIRNCARCSLGSGPCQECVSDDVFDITRNCENREPIFELLLQVSIPPGAPRRFQDLHFHDLGGMVAQAMDRAAVWPSDRVLLSDAFDLPAGAAAAAAAAAPEAAAGPPPARPGPAAAGPGGAAEAWALVVALRPDGSRDAAERASAGAAAAAVRLEMALEAALGGPVRASAGGLALYCPGMRRAPSPRSSCGGPGLGVGGALGLAAAACALLALAGGALWRRRRRARAPPAAQREPLV